MRGNAAGPFYQVKKGRLLLSVKVRPGAGKNSLLGPLNGELVVKIKAPPQKGKANTELVSFLAKALGITKSAVRIVSGPASRHKVLWLNEKCLTALETLARSFEQEDS